MYIEGRGSISGLNEPRPLCFWYVIFSHLYFCDLDSGVMRFFRVYAKAGLTLSCAAILALVVLSLKRGERGCVVVSHSVFSVAQELAQEGDAEAKKATLSSTVNLQPPLNPRLNLGEAGNDFPNVSAANGEAKEIQEENLALNPSVVGQSGSITSLSRRFPRIMIVGFGKTGTKALFEMLKNAPRLVRPCQGEEVLLRSLQQGAVLLPELLTRTSFRRSCGGEEPGLYPRQHGCVADNSLGCMVQI